MPLRYLIAKAILKAHTPALRGCEIDPLAWIGPGAHITQSKVGRYSYVGNFSTVIQAQIGAFCSIASGCIIGGAAHPMDRVSSPPAFHRGRNVLEKNFAHHPPEGALDTYIGNDVWIGSNCLVKSGVRIGDGAVLGMGSVLTKDVGDYEVWAGNPAKIIRRRFDVETASDLARTRWWDYDEAALAAAAKYFPDVSAFLRYARGV